MILPSQDLTFHDAGKLVEYYLAEIASIVRVQVCWPESARLLAKMIVHIFTDPAFTASSLDVLV